MDPQHPPFSRPSLFSSVPPPPYGAAPSPLPRADGRAPPAFEPPQRQEHEPSRASPAYGYPPHSYASEMRPQSRPMSPARFGALRPEPSSGLSARSSPVKQNGTAGKEQPGGLYREEPPTSGHSFTSRQMPPPSPPQPYSSRSLSSSATQSHPPSFSPREPPPGSTHRPGSSMSISSMLGADPDRPSRDQPPSIFSRPSMSSSPFGAAPPPGGAMSPPTAPARPASSLDHPLFRRSQTPEKPYSKSHSARQSRSGSGGGLAAQPPLPETSKFAFGRGPQSFSQYSDKPPSSQASPRTTPTDSHSRRLSISGPIPRPSSQPQNDEARGPAHSPRSRPAGDGSLGSTQRQSSYPEFDSRPPQRYSGIYFDRAREEQAARERERSTAHEPETKPSFGSLLGRYGSHFSDREAERSQQPPPWELGRSQPPSPDARRFQALSESGSGFGFGAIQSYTKSLGSQLGASRPSQVPPSPQHSSASLQARQAQPTPPPNDQPFLGRLQTQPRPVSVSSVPSGSQSTGPGASGSTGEDQRRKGSDDLIQHRTLLGIGADGKRAGRASPLPQAVQGAQAQIMGPTGESGLKGELGRVFAGIGSGVGTGTSGSVGSGPSTPMTASPFKRDSVTGRSESAEDGKLGRAGGSGPGRKRSAKEDESPGEGGGLAVDGRAASSTRGGARRARHVHHHHHHHHHHRHKNDEESAAPQPPSASLYGRIDTPTEAAGGAGNASAAHHHHHRHHHHHIPRPASATVDAPLALPPPRDVQTLVNLDPLLKQVAHLPRHHLGSTLYAPRIGVPSANASLESQKFGYTSTPVPLPRFDGKANCTFTVRVPRFRIDASHREEICARRAVWGTGVYTDDSDPVAAAIHSGYIRGEWGEDVDINMLDLEFKDGYRHALPPPDVPEGEPQIPPVPVANKDLHITLLILPRLERYEATLMFGLKSRAWDGTHDGMSFKVERIDWVDEGSTRGEERSGAARRKRLRNMMRSGRICTGPGLLRMRGGLGGRLAGSDGVVNTPAISAAPVEPVS